MKNKKRFWRTSPDLYGKLDKEFKFDFDPCPYPRPPTYNSLVLPWGKSNYVNPPFLKEDSPHGGPSAFARKAVEEKDRGNASVVILPLPWSISILMKASAEVRYAGDVRWIEAETGEKCSRARPQGIFILKP